MGSTHRVFFVLVALFVNAAVRLVVAEPETQRTTVVEYCANAFRAAIESPAWLPILLRASEFALGAVGAAASRRVCAVLTWRATGVLDRITGACSGRALRSRRALATTTSAPVIAAFPIFAIGDAAIILEADGTHGAAVVLAADFAFTAAEGILASRVFAHALGLGVAVENPLTPSAAVPSTPVVPAFLVLTLWLAAGPSEALEAGWTPHSAIPPTAVVATLLAFAVRDAHVVATTPVSVVVQTASHPPVLKAIDQM